jgi:hypothetical protein
VDAIGGAESFHAACRIHGVTPDDIHQLGHANHTVNRLPNLTPYWSAPLTVDILRVWN